MYKVTNIDTGKEITSLNSLKDLIYYLNGSSFLDLIQKDKFSIEDLSLGLNEKLNNRYKGAMICGDYYCPADILKGANPEKYGEVLKQEIMVVIGETIRKFQDGKEQSKIGNFYIKRLEEIL